MRVAAQGKGADASGSFQREAFCVVYLEMQRAAEILGNGQPKALTAHLWEYIEDGVQDVRPANPLDEGCRHSTPHQSWKATTGPAE